MIICRSPFTVYDFYDFYGFYDLNGFNDLTTDVVRYAEKCEITGEQG